MEFLEIAEHNGAGYKPLVSYEGWRVAVIKYAERFDEENFSRLERHRLTDEVFILTAGNARLVIGGNGDELTPLQFVDMEKGKLYNVKRNVWHHILVNRSAEVIVVENDNTGRDNTEYKSMEVTMKI